MKLKNILKEIKKPKRKTLNSKEINALSKIAKLIKDVSPDIPGVQLSKINNIIKTSIIDNLK